MTPLTFATMAEVTDFGELLNRWRLDGLIFSFTMVLAAGFVVSDLIVDAIKLTGKEVERSAAKLQEFRT